MEKQAVLYETSKYRCLEFPQKQSDDLFLILCGVEQCLPGYAFHSDHRPGYHLHVILSGKGELRMGGRTTPLHFGQMFVTKPEEDIWYQADQQDPWSYCWMSYGGNNAQRYTESAGFVSGVNWLPCSLEQDRFYDLVKRVLDQPNLNRASDLLRLGLLVEYLALAIESNYRSEKLPRRESEYSTDVYVEYAATYIRENFASAKISDVAAYIGIHRSYLTNIFKEKMGISPQEYLMQCRMKQARALLLETDLAVQEVGLRVGYDNALTFSKIFKAYYNASPKHYRQSKQAQADEKNEEKHA